MTSLAETCPTADASFAGAPLMDDINLRGLFQAIFAR